MPHLQAFVPLRAQQEPLRTHPPRTMLNPHKKVIHVTAARPRVLKVQAASKDARERRVS